MNEKARLEIRRCGEDGMRLPGFKAEAQAPSMVGEAAVLGITQKGSWIDDGRVILERVDGGGRITDREGESDVITIAEQSSLRVTSAMAEGPG